MNKYEVDIEHLSIGHEAYCDYLDEDDNVIVVKDSVLTHPDIQDIHKKFAHLYYNFESVHAQARKLRPYKAEPEPELDVPFEDLSDEDRIKNSIVPGSIFDKMQLENQQCAERLEKVEIAPELEFENSFCDHIKQLGFGERTQEYKQKIEYFHEELIANTKSLYTQILRGDIEDAEPVTQTINSLIDIMRTDKDILLNLCNYSFDSDEDHLYYQTTNTTINTLNIAAAMGFDYDTMLEIGQGAFFADIGMGAIQENLRNVDHQYNVSENYEVQKHPIFAANIIDNIKGLRPSTGIIAYQSHERENGHGYPRGRSKNAIHPFAKIVAIADVYSALSSNRRHRKGQRPFYAMKSLISMGKVGLLDITIIAHFMKYASLFPVGSLVRLSNGAIAKVLSSNQDDVTSPIVSVISNFKGEILDEEHYYEINLHNSAEVSIIGTLDFLEIDNNLMSGF